MSDRSGAAEAKAQRKRAASWRRVRREENGLVHVAGGLLAVAVAAVALPFFVAYQVVARVVDRWRIHRHAGVLQDATAVHRGRRVRRGEHRRRASAPSGSADLAAEERETEHVFQYLECGFTGFYPQLGQSDDLEPEAFRLARMDDTGDLDGWDRTMWGSYGLSRPEEYRKYREQVQLGRVLRKATSCMYCDSPLRKSSTRKLRRWEREWWWQYTASTCPVCGWWCVSHFEEELTWCFWSEYYSHAYAVMRRYDPLALETPLALARDYLARNQHKLARFDPFRFEALMADCLKDVFGDCEIVKLGGRRDLGIDIKAVRADGQTFLVQVKRRGDFSRKEGVATVRELHGVMLRENVPHGMVISTAHDFSREAREEVERTRSARSLDRYSMELLPLADVVELLGKPAPPTPSPWERCGISLDVREPVWPAGEDWIDRSALPAGLADVY